MRTTIDLDDRLFRAAKRAAVERGTTLRALVTVGLQRELEAPVEGAKSGIAFGVGSGTWPQGLDISTREKMWRYIGGEADAELKPGRD